MFQRLWAVAVIMFGLGAVLYGFSTLQGMLHGDDIYRHYTMIIVSHGDGLEHITAQGGA